MKKFEDPKDSTRVPATYSLKPFEGGAPVDLSIREERFMAPESYFQPYLANLDVAPLHTLVDQAIQQCPIDARRNLYRSIWLSVRSPAPVSLAPLRCENVILSKQHVLSPLRCGCDNVLGPCCIIFRSAGWLYTVPSF